MYQSASNVMVAIKRETATGVAPVDPTGAFRLPLTDSPGLELARNPIVSNIQRADLVTPMGRLGGKSITGSYNGEAIVGGALDLLLESIMRCVATPAVAITEATAGLTSITTTQNTIVASAGSWITAGVRVGDVITLTDHASAENNGLRLRVTQVTATTITVAGNPLTANAAPDSAFQMEILKKMTNPAVPVRYTHAIEQYDVDIDESELFLGCRLIGLDLSFKPDSPATYVATFHGLDRTLYQSGTSPFYVTPTEASGLSLIADDSAIRYDGTDVGTFTSFDLKFQIAAGGVSVIGSVVGPDVFDNRLTVSGSVSGLRSGFANLTRFDAETEFELSILLSEPNTTPVSCLGIYLPRVKIGKLAAPAFGGDGAKIETLELMVGPQTAGSGVDATTVAIHSSAA